MSTFVYRMVSNLYRRSGWSHSVWWIVCCAVLLGACSLPGSVRPTIKIGLIAPFEGLYRDVGYEALHAVRLAVRERNAEGGVGGRYLVEFVALNDFNEAEEAIVQARKMAVDADVMGVLGGWSEATARASASEFERLGLAFLSPGAELSGTKAAFPVGTGWAVDYEALSGGSPPGPIAIWAYSEAHRLIDALEAETLAEGTITRRGVFESLASSR
jgi:ABC-type branched-subunit amino acid transport system substrate-binding protein